MEPGKISERQLAFLMTTVLLATVIFFMPELASSAVQQDAWITSLLATVWGILAVLIIMALGKRFPGLTLIEYLPLIVGQPLGRLLGVLYAFWFIFIGAALIREFGMLLNSAMMPYIPVGIFLVTIMIVVFYAVRSGLEVWSRVNEILLPILIIVMVLCIILPYSDMDFRRLLPVAAHSPGDLISSSLISGSWRGEIFMVSMLLPALSTSRQTTRNLIIAVLIVGAILTATEIAAVAVFGGLNTGQLEFSFLSLVRMINLFEIFSRFEALIILIWMLGTFIKACCFLYCSTLATAQVMGCKEFQFLLFPITLLMVGLGDNMFANMAQTTDFLSNIWPGLGLVSFELVIPFILYLIALARSKRVGT